jgi:hypothetical protein
MIITTKHRMEIKFDTQWLQLAWGICFFCVVMKQSSTLSNHEEILLDYAKYDG